MHNDKNDCPKPKITVSDSDYDRLFGLAFAASSRMPDVAGELLTELRRATVMPVGEIPSEAVQMGARVDFVTEDGGRRRVHLVFPADANISVGKISILTPVGTALIGLSEGQSIRWTARDGKHHRLTVLSVAN